MAVAVAVRNSWSPVPGLLRRGHRSHCSLAHDLMPRNSSSNSRSTLRTGVCKSASPWALNRPCVELPALVRLKPPTPPSTHVALPLPSRKWLHHKHFCKVRQDPNLLPPPSAAPRSPSKCIEPQSSNCQKNSNRAASVA